jgi:hypothetical protein
MTPVIESENLRGHAPRSAPADVSHLLINHRLPGGTGF